MDIGFGTLIEKFEQHVGVRATRLLIFVLFIAVFALCARAIVDNLVSPLLVFFSTPLWGTTIIQIGLMALAVGLGVAFGAEVIASFRHWKTLREARRILDEARAIHEEQAEGHRSILAASEEISEKNKVLMRGIMALGSRIMQREAATDKDRKAIRALFKDLQSELEDGVAADDGSTTQALRLALERDGEGRSS